MNERAPHPLYFGPDGAALFGWWHAPAGHTAQGLAVVVCNPLGFEEVCAHRSLLHFAQSASAAGFPTLRFDHAGCGDSQGDEFDAHTLARWVAGVNAAIDTARATARVQRVVLVGVRFGATLAALAAAERDDVAGLVAVAPVVRGRGYIRELTMLGQAGATAAVASAGVLESAGFLLTAESTDDLARIDLRNLQRAPAAQVLVVERDDMPAGADWPQALTLLGAAVRVERWPGYAAMMEDPQRTTVPTEMIDGMVRQIRQWGEGLPAAFPGGDPIRTEPLRTRVQLGSGQCAIVRESPVQVPTGTGVSLFGLLAQPERAGGAEVKVNGPAVLMLNPGAVHHIGPNRLWVRLARQWAARGITVLRLDLSGVGDSPARPGATENTVYSEHALQDVAAALDYLRTELGASECHLVGLCSGAYHALKATLAGQPVASAIIINPLVYFWKQGTPLDTVHDYALSELAARYRGTLFTREPWLKLLRGQLHAGLIAQVVRRWAGHAVVSQGRELARWLKIPLHDDLARELRGAVQRGARLRFVFAANSPGYELLYKQGGRGLNALFKDHQASIDLITGADHTFTRLEARERLVALLDRLMPPSATAT